jgi:hypothetical protein
MLQLSSWHVEKVAHSFASNFNILCKVTTQLAAKLTGAVCFYCVWYSL